MIVMGAIISAIFFGSTIGMIISRIHNNKKFVKRGTKDFYQSFLGNDDKNKK